MSEQSCPFASIVPAQQSSEDNPGVPAHLLPPHGSQPATQQTVLSLFSRPTRPLLQVVSDVATAWINHPVPTGRGGEGGRKGWPYARDATKQKEWRCFGVVADPFHEEFTKSLRFHLLLRTVFLVMWSVAGSRQPVATLLVTTSS